MQGGVKQGGIKQGAIKQVGIKQSGIYSHHPFSPHPVSPPPLFIRPLVAYSAAIGPVDALGLVCLTSNSNGRVRTRISPLNRYTFENPIALA